MAKKTIPLKIKKLVKNYTHRLSDEEGLPIQKVIIYGSQAKGTAQKWSDIDVCLISPKFKKPLEVISFLFQKRNHQEVMAGLEPIGFTKKDFKEGGMLIDEIKRTGVEV